MQHKPPSNDLIAKCFLSHFLLHKEDYLQEIAALSTTNSLSLDHTFKVAANIGYLTEDNKWINMLDSLFLVFNDEG